ncbi:hypothetical protein Hanom_Chr08g00754671 [Helianthus anomalus]
MDGVNEPDENDKISNLLDPDAEKQTFGRKSQNRPNLRDENGILLFIFYSKKKKTSQACFDPSILTRTCFDHFPTPSCVARVLTGSVTVSTPFLLLLHDVIRFKQHES